ncbi:beta-aspartyl-peptidase [Vibrio sp. RC27]
MILIQKGELYAPEYRGVGDVLIGGNKILAMEKTINPENLPGEVTCINAEGMNIIPGFVDGHQHFTGGGGEDGFRSRTPEMTLSMNIANGVTTAIGLLGTDSLTRTVENLYAKTQAFNSEGMTAFMLTGAYSVPSPTISGDVGRDITYHDPIVGLKIAMADHRGSRYSADELAKLTVDVRRAAIISGKPGFITVHCGAADDGLDLIFAAIEKHGLRADYFIPTHVNRPAEKLSRQVLELASMGAFIDATCANEVRTKDGLHTNAADFALRASSEGLYDQVCFSSDAGGSLPVWSKDRSQIIGMDIGSPSSMLFELKRLVNDLDIPLEKALKPLTTTPAKAYKLTGRKGELTVGADADLIIMERDSLELRDVIAKGQIMMRDRKLEKKGYFE